MIYRAGMYKMQQNVTVNSKKASQTGKSVQLKVKKDVIGRCSNSSYATLSIVHYP